MRKTFRWLPATVLCLAASTALAQGSGSVRRQLEIEYARQAQDFRQDPPANMDEFISVMEGGQAALTVEGRTTANRPRQMWTASTRSVKPMDVQVLSVKTSGNRAVATVVRRSAGEFRERNGRRWGVTAEHTSQDTWVKYSGGWQMVSTRTQANNTRYSMGSAPGEGQMGIEPPVNGASTQNLLSTRRSTLSWGIR
jgi:hypothetical protein